MDAGAIDDHEGQRDRFKSKHLFHSVIKAWFNSHLGFLEDSDYNPVEEDGKGTPAVVKKPSTPISSSSPGRPRRKVGRPRKYSVQGEGHGSKGGVVFVLTLTF